MHYMYRLITNYYLIKAGNSRLLGQVISIAGCYAVILKMRSMYRTRLKARTVRGFSLELLSNTHLSYFINNFISMYGKTVFLKDVPYELLIIG